MVSIRKEKENFIYYFYYIFLLYIFIAFICIMIITSPFIVIDKLFSSDKNKFDYDSALKNSRKFLNENIEYLNNLSLEYMENHSLESKKFKKVKIL